VYVAHYICVALRAIYPDYKQIWKDWKPARSKPNGYWSDLENQRKFFDNLETKLNIKQPEDWYKIPTQTIVKEGGGFVFHRYGSVVKGT
jgi:hypothetical protein